MQTSLVRGIYGQEHTSGIIAPEVLDDLMFQPLSDRIHERFELAGYGDPADVVVWAEAEIREGRDPSSKLGALLADVCEVRLERYQGKPADVSKGSLVIWRYPDSDNLLMEIVDPSYAGSN